MSDFTSTIPLDYGEGVSTYTSSGKSIGVYGGKFFPPHRGHVNFALRAASMVDVLFVVVQYDQAHERALIEGTDFPLIHPRQRVAWLSEEFADYPNIRVFGQYEHRCDDNLTNPILAHTHANLREVVGGRIDKIFSNTHEYDDYFSTWLPDSEHVVLEGRPVVPVSSTLIRIQGVEKMWELLPSSVRRSFQRRVAVVGWESSGKTYLSKSLSASLNAQWLPEYGRVFYERKGGYEAVVTPSDFTKIAVGHMHQINTAPTDKKMLLIDTDMIYTQFYHKEQYGHCDPVLDAMITSNMEAIDTYVFLEPHNALVQDGSRKALESIERKETSDRLKQMYRDYGRDIHVIDEPDRRLRMEAVTSLLI